MERRFDPELAWRRASTVVLRPEPFGALAYDFTTRQLSFLKSPALVRVVEGLDQAGSVRQALDTAAVPMEEHPLYLAALEQLARTGMITQRVGEET